jgi:hypothetical protein
MANCADDETDCVRLKERRKTGTVFWEIGFVIFSKSIKNVFFLFIE